MKQSQKQRIKRGIVTTFDSIGYLFCFLQWFWVALLYLAVIQPMMSPIAPAQSEKVYQSPDIAFTLPDPVQTTIIAIVVVIMVVITLYALIALPKNIAKTSNRAVHRATNTLVPIAIKAGHKKDTKKNRAVLTPKVLFVVKLALVALPILLTAASVFIDTLAIDYAVATVVGYSIATLSMVFFGLHYAAAKVFRIQSSR